MTTASTRRTGRRVDTSALQESTVDHRYYDFSTRLRVLDEGDWPARLEGTVREWLAEKSIPMPTGIPSVHLSEAVEAKIDRLEMPGVTAFRLTLAEVGTQGEWRTEVLGVALERGGGWISVTVHSQENRFANRPRIVPRLLEGIEVRDGNNELLDDTWIIETPHLKEFLNLLGDPGRNAPVFVTAARPGADLDKVQGWMAARSRELAGLAHSYVLSAEANAHLMRFLGEAHGVRPGTIRSFAPNPVPHDRIDALRHRVVGEPRLASLTSRNAGLLIGRIARFEAATLPEPAILRDARRAFDRKALEDRLRRRRTHAAGAPLAPTRPAHPTLPVAPPSPSSVPPLDEVSEKDLPPSPPVEPGRPTPTPSTQTTPATTPTAAPTTAPAPSPVEPVLPTTPDEAPEEASEAEGRSAERGEEPFVEASTPALPGQVEASGKETPQTEESPEDSAQPEEPEEPEEPEVPAASETADEELPGTVEETPSLDQAPKPVPSQAPDPQLAQLLALTGGTSLADVLDHLRAQEELLEEIATDAQDALAERDRQSDAAAELRRAVGDLELELSSELTRRQTAEQNARLLSVYRDSGQEEVEPESLRLAELQAPEQFSDIPAAIGALSGFLSFTGDASVTATLDEFDTVNIAAKKCWDGLLALHDYARARAAGAHTGGLDAYLRTTPHGFHGFGAANCALKESGPTMERKDLAEQRRFSVPASVDPSGTVLMWPHLKLGKIGRISPRLHFHDDVAGTGKVYVGYIGRHLGISGD